MSLPEAVRQSFIQRMMEHLEGLSATTWESRGHHVAQMMLSTHMRHRGQTLSGNPVGYTVDSYSWQAHSAAEFSVDPKYFLDLRKPQSDYVHAREKHPQAQVILLLSTQEAKSGVASTVANWEAEVVERDGVWLFVADSREIATFFADEVVPNQSAADALAPYFEPLRHLQAEYAATHTIPDPRFGVLKREAIEATVHAALDTHRVVVLAGMSGLGKSETAIAVANARIGRHDWRVWVHGKQLADAAALNAVDVTQSGVRLNLIGMLSTRRCLLVVDDLPATIPLESLVLTLKRHCVADSAVLITSQMAHTGPEQVAMPFMTDAEARLLLDQDAVVACPNHLFRSIFANVGGHPMALGMLNGSAKEGLPWEDVAHDASRVASLPVIERAAVLANVILERWRTLI